MSGDAGMNARSASDSSPQPFPDREIEGTRTATPTARPSGHPHPHLAGLAPGSRLRPSMLRLGINPASSAQRRSRRSHHDLLSPAIPPMPDKPLRTRASEHSGQSHVRCALWIVDCGTGLRQAQWGCHHGGRPPQPLTHCSPRPSASDPHARPSPPTVTKPRDPIITSPSHSATNRPSPPTPLLPALLCSAVRNTHVIQLIDIHAHSWIIYWQSQRVRVAPVGAEQRR
jgi:hypothetical protein